MTQADITKYRLLNQLLVDKDHHKPEEVVAHLGAMQAQDYPGALWALGLRSGTAIQGVEQAITDKKIVRTWPMRGTLHFVSPTDIRWMLKLMTPKVITGAASRHRNLELTDKIFDRSRQLLTRALQGGRVLTRNQMCQVLEDAGIGTKGQRGIHIFWVLSQEGLLCYGPHQGKEPTFVLLDEWLPPSRDLVGEEAVTELTQRYFKSHGPSTAQDFGWWSGLTQTQIKSGLTNSTAELRSETIDGKAYWMAKDLPNVSSQPKGFLLPGFDEYLLGYKDRSAALHVLHSQKVVPGGNGVFISTIVINGRIAGTWKLTVRKSSTLITLNAFTKLTKADKILIAEAAEHYGKFIGTPVEIS